MRSGFCQTTLAILLAGQASSMMLSAQSESQTGTIRGVDHPINFSKEIKPIIEESCIKCHGRGRNKGGLQLDTRETLLKGGDSGPAVVPGKSAESLLIKLVAGLDPDNVMPKKGSRLTAEQVGLLRAW